MEIEINLNLTIIYLDLARSFAREEFGNYLRDFMKRNGDLKKGYHYAFGIMSGACIYSHLAIEAFANSYLQKIKDEVDMNKTPFINNDKFKYPNEEYIKSEKLKSKLKNICLYENLPFYSEMDQPLWIRFTNLLIDKRDFFTHPKPDEKTFQKNLKEIFEKNIQTDYIDIAEGIIGYIYTKTAQVKPDFLEGNTMLYIDEIKIIEKKDFRNKFRYFIKNSFRNFVKMFSKNNPQV